MSYFGGDDEALLAAALTGFKAVYYGVRIGTSTLSEFNKSSRVPITRKKF